MQSQSDFSNKQSSDFQYQVYDTPKSYKVNTGDQFKSQYQQNKKSINDNNKKQKNQPTYTQVHRSNYLQQYNHYFQEVQNQADNHIKYCLSNTDQAIKHKIIIINNNSSFWQLASFTVPTIIISGNLYGGIIIKYQIIIGSYRLKVDLLNIKKNASNTLIKIGYGCYGSIYRIKYSKTKTIVTKRILFKSKNKTKFQEKQILPNRLQIHESLYQYSIYKICSFYKIGPKIANELGFDLACFANCLQFYMQECQRVRSNCDRIENDLKLCLRILHKIKIIHKDVKPANILFSHQQNRYVLCDFGISHPVEEQIGFKSKTYKQGSAGFMSPQMQNLAKDNQSYVDLYYNDLYGLKCSVNQFVCHYQTQTRQNVLRVQRGHQYGLKEILSVIGEQVYRSIYLFKLYLTLKYVQLLKQEQILYLTKVNFLLEQVFQIYTQKQFTTISSLIDEIQKRENSYCLQYLIRCYGLTMQLIYELNKLKPTQQIYKLKKVINDEKQNNFISEQKLKKLKKLRDISHRNRYEFSLEQQIVYYKQLQKQLNTSFKEKILQILLQIFYSKIQVGFDFYTLIKLIDQIKQTFANSDIKVTQDIFVFFSVTQVIIRNECQKVKNYKKISKQVYPNSQQKVYTCLFKYYLTNLDNNDQIIKYGKKLQKIYIRQQKRIQIKSYLWLLSQLAIAQKNKIHSFYYFQQLKQLAHLYLDSIPEIAEQAVDVYRYLGMYSQAYQLFQQALKFYGKQLLKIKYFYGDYQIKQARCYINMGKCFCILGKLQQAYKYIKLALEIINFNSYNYENLRMQDKCLYLLCVICLMSQNQQLLIDYYNQLIFGNIQKQLIKSRQDNEILIDNNQKVEHKIYKLSYQEILKQFYRVKDQNQEKAKVLLSNMEMKFQTQFIYYRKQRYYMSQLAQECKKHQKKSKFISQKLNKLQLNQKSLNFYIQQKLKITLKLPRHDNTLLLMEKALYFQSRSTMNNYLLINQVDIKICQQWQLVGNLQRCIQYCKKRIR